MNSIGLLSFRFSGKSVKVIPSKPQKVTPKTEEEHTLQVKMPQGSTERSKKLLAKQKQAAATAAGGWKLFSTIIHHTSHIICHLYTVIYSTVTLSAVTRILSRSLQSRFLLSLVYCLVVYSHAFCCHSYTVTYSTVMLSAITSYTENDVLFSNDTGILGKRGS